jgi:hypothetical protein
MAQSRSSFWRSHRWLAILLGVVLILLAVSGVVLTVIAHRFEPFLRAALVDDLQQRFHTRVELDSFHVALGNGLDGEWGIWATGRGLRIWPPQVAGADRQAGFAPQPVPLIALEEFRFHVPLRYQPGKAISISRVRLVGLKVVVPPRSQRDKARAIPSPVTNQKPSPAGTDSVRPQSSPSSAPQPNPKPSSGAGMLSNLVVERIDCERAQLILETDKPGKLPLGFAISHLQLSDITTQRPIGFDAQLTNPKPQGFIHTTGKLGPWLVADPGETPVSGAYTFEHADLATFQGIAGILSSSGSYQGTLRDILVDGKADVPDFRLTHFGNPLPLHTQFHAKVDGTDGDTWLDPVDATLGHSHFTTQGMVVRVRPSGSAATAPVSSANLPPLADFGHDIELNVNVDRGHIEDFLRLANRSQTPVLTGALLVKATLHIPPGAGPVYERMRLDGSFKLDQAHFTDAKIQGRIMDLSLRGQGRPGELKSADANDITSEMQSDFHMANAVITLPNLQYNVPGAAIQLQGKYALEGLLHFEGTARMQATVSQMVGGWKGFLLKPADRFFKKDGAGTLVPIEIRGPHDAPEFSVDFNRMKKTSPETPGQKAQ